MPGLKLKTLALASVTLLGTSQWVHAQYVGPSAQQSVSSVADIFKHASDDQRVILRGYLIKQVSSEKYLFSDGSGDIRVEIDAEDFRGQTVNEKTQVELIGEVEKDFLESPEVDVDIINVVPG
ncbi:MULTISPECIES: NirD/YgiW/YdeI family stress tolerance protein [unclassified Oceanobacter]|uniref:NirD/YgiW/YdeI family stress tolerance protein n=1 Tax=unclassified Oceanobacter TaxID=2620260 RepID=UPI0026E1D280|nr:MULTISPECIES: NirD/YgiW/YdeI family stress tolerance protein [unclassified Oceanobacter]MDO6683672.1 NirD/YgiW/YdeI family stress tolerance protein [Oceanobacter sp. 5_MG-2023]MDP2546482.1 NirD/YgiW/YdeI family stress tolerance protein [Oceanobacter sp. 4_MG-2023]MDP2609810.1 NirD/YgiW/YdeI family stress tolerance protein [Oceanobacter sp. 1_MG-2023]MDP2613141.1 NirD/YgiW/YdeI family stress tolerance protein [Oceanobacter sp. 2_MG-2023]